MNKLFQFTPLREGRQAERMEKGAEKLYFNSRPSARGDEKNVKAQKKQLISIHAPPRGATGEAQTVIEAQAISIHAPPRGATAGRWCYSAGIQFQFTPLREGRRKKTTRKTAPSAISIHAPPRGATAQRTADRVELKISIHAPPRGATSSGGGGRASRRISIHAPPRGATCDTAEQAKAAYISIHAPPRGATYRT